MVDIITRAGKGAPLTHDEMDANLTNIKTAIEADASPDLFGAAILADAPVGYWRLNDASGATTLADSSGNGYAATVTAGTFRSVRGWAPKRVGAYLKNGFVATFPTNMCTLATSDTGITFEMCELVGSATGSYPSAMSLWNTAGNLRGEFRFAPIWASAVGSPALLSGAADTGNSWTAATGSDVPTTGPWHHIVGTFDGTSIKLYVDGLLVSTVGWARAMISNPYGGIGTSPNSDPMNTGFYSDFAIYSKALTADQVASHYAAMLKG